MPLPTEFDEREIGLAVLEALDPGEELTAAELDHRAWRWGLLLWQLYEFVVALGVARAEHVDLEPATGLVAVHGCSSRLAVRILL